MTDRMPGRYAQPWCPTCHAPAGPDCADRSKSPRQVRRRLRRDLERDAAEACGEREVLRPGPEAGRHRGGEP